MMVENFLLRIQTGEGISETLPYHTKVSVNLRIRRPLSAAFADKAPGTGSADSAVKASPMAPGTGSADSAVKAPSMAPGTGSANSAVKAPPMASARDFAMVKPKPVPDWLLAASCM